MIKSLTVLLRKALQGHLELPKTRKLTAKLAKVSGEGQKQIKNQPDFNDSYFMNQTCTGNSIPSQT